MVTSESEARYADLRIFQHRPWSTAFPRLLQGITGRGSARFGSPAEGPADARDGWLQLREATGMERIARCRQVHGAAAVVCDGSRALPSAPSVVGEADALITVDEGVLLVVTVADCVPVFLVDPEARVLGLAHAGWRGTAAGVAEATLARMIELGADPGRLHAHLGPAICGECYEVGPEVPAALGQAAGTTHVDLRAHLGGTLRGAGVAAERVTASGACTRCETDRYYSYRGGDRRRRMCAFIGWRPR